MHGAEVFECGSANCDNVRQSLLPRWPWLDCMSAHSASNPSPVVMVHEVGMRMSGIANLEILVVQCCAACKLSGAVAKQHP